MDIDLIATPKYDGSNIQIWYDKYKHSFECYTLGSLNEVPIQPNISSTTFKQMAFKLLSTQDKQYLEDNPDKSGIFELMSKLNPIVTKYQEEKLVPLIGIDSNGIPFQWPFSSTQKWIIDRNKDNFDDQLQYFQNEMVKNPNDYGLIPEGLVVYIHYKTSDIFLPIIKVKRYEYCQLHHNVILHVGSISDLNMTERLVLNGNSDDVLTDEIKINHANKFKAYLSNLISRMEECSSKTRLYNDRKSQAQIVLSFKEKWAHPYLFERLGNEVDINSFSEWILKSKNATSPTVLDILQRDSKLERMWFE